MTPQSIVRSLLPVGWKVWPRHRKEPRERDDDRSRERADTKVGVILGVDTHTPRRPHGGGRGPSGQTPGRVERASERKGLREAPLPGRGLWPREVRWDRRYQQLRGLKLARHLKAQGLKAQGIEVLEVGTSEAPAAKLVP